jgi:regulator of sigma E protease
MEGFFGILMTAILPFLLVLTVIIFVHEYGHFQVARWLKVRVDTFSIGFGSAIAQWRGRDGMIWQIGSIPLGGYVKFSGDKDEASAAPTDEAAAIAPDRARAEGYFHAQGPGVRSLIAAAGPVFNFVFAALVFALVFAAFGRDYDPTTRPVTVERLNAQSAAGAAGVQAGDVIVSLDGRAIANLLDLRETLKGIGGGETAILVVERDGERVATEVAFRTPAEAHGRLGIVISQRETLGVGEAIGAGAKQVVDIVVRTADYLWRLITLQADASQLSSVIGMTHTTHVVVESAVDIGTAAGGGSQTVLELTRTLLIWMALLSVAVGFMNLLPIPVLDGGQILMNAIEAVRRKPLPAKGVALAYQTGFALLITMFLFASWNDLQRLNALEFVQGMLS